MHDTPPIRSGFLYDYRVGIFPIYASCSFCVPSLPHDSIFLPMVAEARYQEFRRKSLLTGDAKSAKVRVKL